MPLSSSETVEYTPCCVDSCEKQEEITLLICLLIFESCVRGSIKNKTDNFSSCVCSFDMHEVLTRAQNGTTYPRC